MQAQYPCALQGCRYYKIKSIMTALGVIRGMESGVSPSIGRFPVLDRARFANPQLDFHKQDMVGS